jgi:hypothetical protein
MENNDGSSSSISSDSSWSQSTCSEEDSDDDDEYVWKETPLQASRIRLITDKLDDIMTNNYGEETSEIRRRIQNQVSHISSIRIFLCK